MLPVVLSGSGLRLLVGALPITVLFLIFGALAILAMILPADRRVFVLKLTPHLVRAVEKIAQSPQVTM